MVGTYKGSQTCGKRGTERSFGFEWAVARVAQRCEQVRYEGPRKV